MERTTNTLKLTNGEEVKVISALTWGEKEKIDSVIIGGVKVDNSGLKGYDMGVVAERQYQLLELCVKEIITNGESKQFTREWMDNLSVEDGDLVFQTVDALTKKKA